MASRRRLSCALGTLLALGLAPAAGAAPPRAVVAFLPATPTQNLRLLDDFARAGMSVGLVSPVTGGFERAQVPLDIGQGTRIPTRLYDRDLPALRLVDRRIEGWDVVRARAREAPGDVVPGLLAETLGGRVGYARMPRGSTALAPAAADAEGEIRVTGHTSDRIADTVRRLWEDAPLVLADLPRGRAGLDALRELIRADPAALVFAMQAPAGDRLRILPAGLAAPGRPGLLRSATTRRDGLIAATDIAPTVLRHMGVAVPEEMQGQKIERVGGPSPGELRGLAARLGVVGERRGPALFALVGGWLALLALATGARAPLLRRAVARTGLLAVLWMPAFGLLAAALRPNEGIELALLAGGSIAAAALTDRLIAWPAAPWVPAAVSLAAHTVDLARGSSLIGQAVTGPNPAGGARFYGVGNELEILLALTVLLGTGAWLSRRRTPIPKASDPLGFGVAGAVVALVLGAGRLGADVGAVITLGAGTAAAVVASRPGGATRRAVAIAVATPVAAVGILALVDLATGGDSHFARSVLGAGDGGDLGEVAQRRLEGSLAGVKAPGGIAATLVAVALLAWLAVGRPRIDAGPAWRAALVGGWFAVVFGALGNDSGPLILWVGAAVLGLALVHARSPQAPADARRS